MTFGASIPMVFCVVGCCCIIIIHHTIIHRKSVDSSESETSQIPIFDENTHLFSIFKYIFDPRTHRIGDFAKVFKLNSTSTKVHRDASRDPVGNVKNIIITYVPVLGLSVLAVRNVCAVCAVIILPPPHLRINQKFHAAQNLYQIVKHTAVL